MKKLFVTMAIVVFAATIHAQVVISAKDFAAELKTNKEMVVIDPMGADVYAKQHISGAINIPHKSLYKEGPVEGQFKSPEELADIFGKKGVNNNAKIVIYDDGSQKYNSRLWWILKYLGAQNVYLLHKDMTEFEKVRIPLTGTATVLKATTFTVTLDPTVNIMMNEVEAAMKNPNAIILDAREKDEFDGVDKDKRSKGHLPGAVWMNFKEVLTSTGAFKTKEEIIASASKFGVTPEKEIIIYCQTGIKAATLYIALKELAGFTNVKLYGGAYAEWAADSTKEIVK